jgi:hypothetical protein
MGTWDFLNAIKECIIMVFELINILLKDKILQS